MASRCAAHTLLQAPGARRGRGRDQQLFTYHALLGPILRLHKLIPGSSVRHGSNVASGGRGGVLPTQAQRLTPSL